MCDIETPNVSNLEDISSFCGTSCDLLSVPQDVLITSPTPVKFNKEERCYRWSFAKRKTQSIYVNNEENIYNEENRQMECSIY